MSFAARRCTRIDELADRGRSSSGAHFNAGPARDGGIVSRLANDAPARLGSDRHGENEALGARVSHLVEETVDDRIVNFLHVYCATRQTEFTQPLVGTGRWTEKVAPRPGSESTRTSPP